MRPIILIPTYNESVSIVELLEKLSALRSLHEFQVLVIDDNSPDKTADIVESLRFSWVSILRRPRKAGLGAAYRAGFDEVLSNGNFSHVVTMDADGSHRVEDLPAMFEAATSFSDSEKVIVLGTR